MMADTQRNQEARPDPDALLALTAGGRGRLTLFLGAAPGVGKTYAMLLRARTLKAEGADIVVGLVETHGRRETGDLLRGLEILPRREISHQGRAIEEFDLDAALRRRPQIIIVDELAHTNAPDSRHPKRYLDVKELLDAGIDVWSAVNVQHLESLADVVAQITGVQVRERVPDTVLKMADNVLLVDLEPAELIERLKEGKVYLPENARRAADSFFRLGNLTALRELALRRTADRVDDQVIEYLKQNAIEGAWQTAERLLVCIGPDDLSERVVRTGARLASGLNAPWLVMSVERADGPPGSPTMTKRLEANFNLAASLGAETRRVTGHDFVEEILKTARREHATQIVIGGRRQPFPARLFRRSLPDALIDNVSGIGIHVVTAETRGIEVVPPAEPRRSLFRNPVLEVGLPIVFVGMATILGRAMGSVVELPNVSLLYLLAVLVSAVHAGHAAALVSAILSAVSYNFFFIQPIHTFTIASPHEVFGFIVFIIAALIAGGLASRLGEQAAMATRRAAATQSLYDFSRKLSGTVKVDDVVWAAVSQLRSSLRRDIVLLRGTDGDLAVSAAWPPDTELDVTDMAAARWARQRNEPAGNFTGTLPRSRFQFRPLAEPEGVATAVIGFRTEDKPLDPEEERTLGAILDQTAVAIDRARLSGESLEQAARLVGDRFRASLLSSISHDLKTPLATIAGAVSSLRQLGDRMKPESRADLLASIEEESERLTRFVSNLLDMTRIEAGAVEPRNDWVDVADLVHGTVQRASKLFPERKIETSLAGHLPMVRGDSVLLGHVLFNLLDNAVRHGGGETVSIYARVDAADLVISVTDLGRGIPAKALDRVFEKFFRRGKPDGRTPGTGLGLAIAKGFVEAMGGTIRAESPAVRRRGTRMTIRLPLATGGDAKKSEA